MNKIESWSKLTCYTLKVILIIPVYDTMPVIGVIYIPLGFNINSFQRFHYELCSHTLITDLFLIIFIISRSITLRTLKEL